MQRRNKIILIVVSLLAIAAVIFLAVWTRPSGEVAAPTNQQTGAAQNVNAPAVEGPAVQEIEQRQATPEEIATREIAVLSQSFAERFGTYSNDGNFQNIIDLYPQMTSSMADWAEGYVAKLRGEIQKTTYEGATTRAISTSVTSLDLGAAKAETLVKTQRVTAKAGAGGKIESTTLYQDLRLEFKKVGNEWKVDGAYWVK